MRWWEANRPFSVLLLSFPTPSLAQVTGTTAEHGIYVVFPAKAETTVNTRTEERRRSLFKVPVFQADLNFDASFDLAGVPSAAPLGAVFDWNRAEIVVGVSDPRGALSDGTLTINGKTATFVPAQITDLITLESNPGRHLQLTLFGVQGEHSISLLHYPRFLLKLSLLVPRQYRDFKRPPPCVSPVPSGS